MNKTIKVKIENKYGRTLIYPVCAMAKKFADLVNQKTLTNKEIEVIKSMGFEIEVIQELKSL